MRARTLTKKLDKIFWFVMLLLPLIIYIVDNITVGMVRDYQFADQNFQSLIGIFETMFGYDESSIVYQICDWLTANVYDALGPILYANTLIAYVGYMVQVEILHLILDIFLFIFKYARTLMDKWGCVDG